MHANLTKAIAEKGDQSAKLDVQIIFKKNELDTLEKGIEYIAEAMSVTYVITSFLYDPNSLNKYDFDYLVNLMVGLRQVRLGVGPKLVKDANGKVICSCQVPELHWKTPLEEKDMEHARERLAFLLMPLVKTEFVPKVWHDILKIQLGIDKLKL
jgi:hypothetical protein